jgi:hypothetical protein
MLGCGGPLGRGLQVILGALHEESEFLGGVLYASVGSPLLGVLKGPGEGLELVGEGVFLGVKPRG